MRKVILTMGLPASGKTTWAKEYVRKNPNTVIVCKDDIRFELFGDRSYGKRENQVIEVRNQRILDAINEEKDVIVADTNLNPIHLQTISKLVKGFAEVNIQDFTNVSLEECIKRDAAREDKVGENVIRGMYNEYLRTQKIVQNPNLPKAILVDIDGTLAIHNRSPYNYEECHTDSICEQVRHVVNNLEPDFNIIVMSGRPDNYKNKTLQWLKDNNVRFDELHMRKAGDMRNDAVVKQELFEAHVKDKYYVQMVFDDRPRVIRMWKALGLFVFNVGDGNEF